MPESVVLLHGFSGTRHAWDGVTALLDPQRYTAVALDLPGHGGAGDCERPITFDACVARVLEQAPERFVLCGYSLGGRVALHVALAAPERVRRLVLVSASPGIEDAAERARRRAHDERLAGELEQEPFEQFIERWRTQPLFGGEPPEVGRLAREDQRRNSPSALAAALRGLGTGEMAPLWERLGELNMPVTVLVGERDEKYTGLGRRTVELLGNGELVLAAGGHGLVLENPAAVAAVIAKVHD